jgi:hypothetical protein
MKKQFENNSLSPYTKATKILENSNHNYDSGKNNISIKKIKSRSTVPNIFYKPITKIINFNEFE